MSKILKATCLAGVVKVGALPIPEATILCQGVASSSGVLLMEGDEQTYIADTTDDLKTTLDKVSSALSNVTAALTEIGNTLTAIGAGMTGPTTAPPPTIATSVATITTKVTAITGYKANLDTLKGAMK